MAAPTQSVSFHIDCLLSTKSDLRRPDEVTKGTMERLRRAFQQHAAHLPLDPLLLATLPSKAPRLCTTQ